MSHEKPGAAALCTIASADGDQWRILRELLPYLWPKDRADLRWRVALAMLALVLSKVVTVATPYAFKYATDCLTASGGAAAIAFASRSSSFWPMASAAS